MRSLCSIALLAFCVACGGSTTSMPDGPLKLGIVSGNNQIAAAGSPQLTNPVVGRLVRVSTASGPRFEFVKTAYAQTVVTGSPVPGAVVCAHELVPGEMVPFVPCTNTDANGSATFFFTPGTKAGEAKSEIRGTLAGQPAVFDTATAIIAPAPATEIGQSTFGPVPASASVDLHDNIMTVRDQYGNFIYLRGDVGPLGTPSFTPTFVVRDGDTPPAGKWTDSGLPRPAGTQGWIVPLTGWSGHRVTVFFWIGDAEAHFTVDVT